VATGSTIQLTDAVTGGTWTSSPATVATIDPNTGVVSGITAGNATIIYTVTNPNGSNSISANILVTAAITPAPPCTLTAKFSVNSAAQCITGNNFIFTDESTGAGSALVYNWDFNNGNNSVLQNPVHVYNAAASHDVTMTVTDANGCTSEYVLQITVGAEPVASFNADYNTGSGNGTTFLSTSTITEGSLNYNWDLGDGTTSDLSNPTVYYAKGDYKVKLVVSGIGSCKDSVTELIKIDALKNPVTASPNPASSFTNISFTSISGQANAIIKVHDANGKLVIEKSVATSPAGTMSNISLYVGGLTNGTYYVIILDEDHHKIGTVTIIKS
jgi:PKD repeat protein